jgi:pimeloyl-ACP methyl ester carboxylesterase
MGRDDKTVKPPSFALLATEGRGLLDIPALFAAAPFLAAAPHGKPHPVLVLPGLGADDRSTIAIRGFLERLGSQVYGWGRDADVSAVAAQVAKLREDSGLKVSLIGWSRGGIIAREVVRQVPNSVRMVISLGSPFAAPGANNVRATWKLLTGKKYEPPTPERVSRLAQPTSPVDVDLHARRRDGRLGRVPGARRQRAGERRGQNPHIGLGFHAPALWVIADRLAQPAGIWKPPRTSKSTRQLIFTTQPSQARRGYSECVRLGIT